MATLGLTAIVVVVAQILGLALQLGPLAVWSQLIAAGRRYIDGGARRVVAVRHRRRGRSRTGLACAVRHADGGGRSSRIRIAHHSGRNVATGAPDGSGHCSAFFRPGTRGAILLIGAVVGIIYGIAMAPTVRSRRSSASHW